jgi:hypothetical protein
MGSVFLLPPVEKCVPVLVWYIDLSLVSTLVLILAAQTFPEQGAHPSQLRTAPNSRNAPVQGALLYPLVRDLQRPLIAPIKNNSGPFQSV